MTISDGFKKLTLAAIGAGAITYEKTSEILGHLVEKGEITVDQGKIINSELKQCKRVSNEPEGDCEGGGPKGKGRSRRKACNER